MEEEVKSVENYVLIAGIVACVVGAIVASTGGEDPTRVIYVPLIDHFFGVKVPLLVIKGVVMVAIVLQHGLFPWKYSDGWLFLG